MRPLVTSFQRYAFIVAGLTFVTMLTVAGVRSAPGVLMVPWETAFGWERTTVAAGQRLNRLRAGGDDRQPLVPIEPRAHHGHPLGEHSHR
jgi:hypothetical protein